MHGINYTSFITILQCIILITTTHSHTKDKKSCKKLRSCDLTCSLKKDSQQCDICECKDGWKLDNVACGKKKCNRCVLEKNARGCGVCKCAAANTAQKCGQRPVNCKTECLTMVEGCLKCICLNVTPGPLLPIGNISLQIYGDSIAQNTTKLMCRSATKCTANCSFIKTENDCYRCDCGIVSTPSPTTQASIYTTVACEKIVDCKGNCTFVQYDWSENGCSMCHCT